MRMQVQGWSVRKLGLAATWLSIVLGVAATAARAQEPVTDSTLVQRAQAAYEQLDYARAEQYAQQVVRDYENYSVEQLTEVHTILGLINYSQNQPVDAGRHFEAALSLDPDLTLDPLLVSPKILSFLEDVREGRAAQLEPERGDGSDAPVRYLQLEDRRPAAALRSMVVPGWGQLYKGEPTKGWLLLGLWSATAAGSGLAHWQRHEAREAYERVQDPSRVDGRYDTYADWHRARNNLLLAAAGVWLYSYLDAILQREPSVATSQYEARVRLGSPARGPGLHVSLQF